MTVVHARVSDEPGLQCLTCLDVIADRNVMRVEGSLRQTIHPGYIAPSCHSPTMRTCPPNHICVNEKLNWTVSCKLLQQQKST